MSTGDFDDRIRSAAFSYLDQLVAANGGVVSSKELDEFEFDGRRIALRQHMRGIRKLSELDAAISILTTYAERPQDRPYDDGIGPDGYQRYKWRGTDGDAYDNAALRVAMEDHKPLMWFLGIGRGIYMPVYPIWLVGEEPVEHQFVVAIEEGMREQWGEQVFHPADVALRRQYAEATVMRRLHQPAFRIRALNAYNGSCALCRLRHPELLDAAHIKEDSDGGEPVVPNGVAMCAIHHRAFDANVLGIRPDFIAQIREDVLEEHDGPTLRHALQGVHGEKLVLPRQRAAYPDRTLLEQRFEMFLRASLK